MFTIILSLLIVLISKLVKTHSLGSCSVILLPKKTNVSTVIYLRVLSPLPFSISANCITRVHECRECYSNGNSRQALFHSLHTDDTSEYFPPPPDFGKKMCRCCKGKNEEKSFPRIRRISHCLAISVIISNNNGNNNNNNKTCC